MYSEAVLEVGIHLDMQTLDAHLLLGKLHYTCGKYEEALRSFHIAGLDNLVEKSVTSRSIRILAESFAIKGNNCRSFVSGVIRGVELVSKNLSVPVVVLQFYIYSTVKWANFAHISTLSPCPSYFL